MTTEPAAWIVAAFFDQLQALAHQLRTRAHTHAGLAALGDALVATCQARTTAAQHVAYAASDPLRYAALAAEQTAFGQHLVDTATNPASLELMFCWLAFAPWDLLDTLRTTPVTAAFDTLSWTGGSTTAGGPPGPIVV